MVGLNKRPVRAVIYCRISLATHGDQVKVKRQEKRCRKLAERLGWEVVHVYCDNNKSAWQRNRSRKDWDAMLQAVERGEVDAIVVYHGDRLIRQPWDLELLLNISDEKNILLASPTGVRDLANSDHRYMLRIDVAQACKESDNISRRTKDAHADRAEKGIVRKGGNRAYGYKRSGKVKEAEAEEYRDAVARVLAGESKRSIVREWNQRGLVTTCGNPWSVLTLTLVLKNPRYAGLSTYKGEIVGKGKWKPLIEHEQWEALQAALGVIAETYGTPGLNTTSKYLLTYYATCSSCGSTVEMHHNGGGDSVGYLCRNTECSKRMRRNMRNVDAFVVGAVLTHLADPRMWEALAEGARDNSAGAELAVLREKRRATKEQFTDSVTMTPAELDEVLRKLDAQIAGAEARVAERQKVHVLDGCRDMTPQQWAALPMDRRRAIVKATVTVELLPTRRGRYFDVNSVQVLPKAVGLQLVNGTKKAAVGK